MLHRLSVSIAILRLAAFFVPRSQRTHWLAEWKGELWHVCRAYGVLCGSAEPHGRAEITAFCLGAFQDGLALRLHAVRSQWNLRLHAGAPGRVVAILSALLLTTCAVCVGVPGARQAIRRSSPGPTDTLVLLSSEGSLGAENPTIRFGDYQALAADGSPFLKGSAFYRPTVGSIRVGRLPSKCLHIGYAGRSMMSILHSSLLTNRLEGSKQSPEPLALLSQRTWRQDFHSDPRAIGQTFLVDTQWVTVAGIASGNFWPISGEMDIVLIESDAELARRFSTSRGFVLAPSIRPALRIEDPDRPYVVARDASGAAVRLECLTLAQRREKPGSLFLFALLLACMALPALTPLPLGEYPKNRNSAPGRMYVQRWSFLGLKFALILPTAFLMPLVLCCCLTTAGSTTAAYIQISLSFLTLLFALRWALQDQRQRCPSCLRLLSHPALVGHASRNFLAWSGTELLCLGGHGFLHIPEHPTSWFSTQRWLPVDSTWSELFSHA